jgi:hypothetical protein
MILPDIGTFLLVIAAVMLPLGIGFIAGYCARMKDEKSKK